MSSPWTVRYADLAGKAVIVAGADAATTLAVCRSFVGCRALVAVLTPDRGTVADVVAAAQGAGVEVLGLAADPADPAVWARVAPQVEQRLSPIDVVVAIGPQQQRHVMVAAVTGDMSARGRGVVVEVGAPVEVGAVVDVGDGPASRTSRVRSRLVSGGSPTDVAAAVLLCASDVMTAASMTVQLET